MERVKWGLIGCGEISRKAVAPAIRDITACELTAVCSGRLENARSLAGEFGVERCYGTWEELVQDDSIDAVYVATPHYLHAPQTIAAAQCGKHVLCEKPMALRSEDCRGMIEACAEGGVKLGIAYYRHFYPIVRRLKELLSSQAIGTVSLCQIDCFSWYGLQPGDPQYWQFEKGKCGGGPLMLGGCHRIEVLLDLLGPIENTVSVRANVHANRETDDTEVAVFRFKSGPTGVLCMTHSVRESRDTLFLHGSEGSIHIPVLNRGRMTLVQGSKTITEEHPRHPNTHFPLIQSFCQSIRSGEEPVVNGQIGLQVQMVEDAIYQLDV